MTTENKSKKPKGFTLYTDLKPIIDRLSNDPMLKAIYAYMCQRTEPDFDDDFYGLAWELIREKLDASIEYHERAVEYGRKGGKAAAQKKRRAPKAPLGSISTPKAPNRVSYRQDKTRLDKTSLVIDKSPSSSSLVEGLTTDGEIKEEFDPMKGEFDD